MSKSKNIMSKKKIEKIGKIDLNKARDEAIKKWGTGGIPTTWILDYELATVVSKINEIIERLNEKS